MGSWAIELNLYHGKQKDKERNVALTDNFESQNQYSLDAIMS
jgi:hypothetical protein